MSEHLPRDLQRIRLSEDESGRGSPRPWKRCLCYGTCITALSRTAEHCHTPRKARSAHSERREAVSRQLLRDDPVIGVRYLPGIRERVEHEGGGYLVRTNAAGFRCDHEFEK